MSPVASAPLRRAREAAHRILPALVLLACATSVCATSQSSTGYLQRDEFRSFVDRMVARHDFTSAELMSLFSHVKPRPDIIKAISNPAEAKPWYQYRPIFVTQARALGGVEFWRAHAETLARAERVYGVPAQVIVAVIGVETRYGRHKGRYPVLEALSTLAFDYPERGRFFRSELEHYLLLTREEGIDPLSITGSYAGAMGAPQFISSSYRRYAVDFDGDGKRDLWNSYPDIIGSIANYFAAHGWRPGEPIAAPAQIEGGDYKRLQGPGLKPKHSLRRMREHGVTTRAELAEEQPAALITLETRDGLEYWLGLHNFYVITRYNHSALYAMAVYLLSRKVAEQYGRMQKAAVADR